MSVSMKDAIARIVFSRLKSLSQSFLQTKEIIGLCLKTRKARTLECQWNGKSGIINELYQGRICLVTNIYN